MVQGPHSGDGGICSLEEVPTSYHHDRLSSRVHAELVEERGHRSKVGQMGE